MFIRKCKKKENSTENEQQHMLTIKLLNNNLRKLCTWELKYFVAMHNYIKNNSALILLSGDRKGIRSIKNSRTINPRKFFVGCTTYVEPT